MSENSTALTKEQTIEEAIVSNISSYLRRQLSLFYREHYSFREVTRKLIDIISKFEDNRTELERQ